MRILALVSIALALLTAACGTAADMAVTPSSIPAESPTGAAAGPAPSPTRWSSVKPPPWFTPPSPADLPRIQGGREYVGYGVRLLLPDVGEFTLGPGIADPPPGTSVANWRGDFLGLYWIQGESSLFLRIDDSPQGPKVVEISRYVNPKHPEAAAVFDEIVRTMGVAPPTPTPTSTPAGH